MTNNIYDNARFLLLTAGLDWRTVPLVMSAWGGTPTFNPADKTVANIIGHGFTELGYSMTVTGQAVSPDGYAQSNPVLIPGVPTGQQVTWFSFSWQNATHINSQLILFIDQAEGIPFHANGLDMIVQPDWALERGWWRP